MKNTLRTLLRRDPEQVALARKDLAHSLRLHRLCLYLGWQDVKQRYRRSFLGPFWITLSMMLFIFVIGYLNGALFKRATSSFIPYLCIGYVIWDFISVCVNDATRVFAGAENLIRQISLPLSFHVFRHVIKNFYIFLHNVVLVLLVFLLFQFKSDGLMWTAAIGLAALIVNLVAVSLYVGVLATRFRDLEQLVKSVMQILFFFTPIVWPLEVLPPERAFLLEVNPFFFLTEAIRGPLLGRTPELAFWLKLLGVTVVNCCAAMWLFCRYRKRIAYWL